jgi:hypothetical protein
MITSTILLLAGCSMREINLSGYRSPKPDNVSYLLVDKNPDYSMEAMISVEKIDNVTLDLINDPCVYLIKGGNHTLIFSARDFRSGNNDVRHRLVVTSLPGKYYQVLPIRSNDELTFSFAEIDTKKPKQIHRREMKSMAGYLLHGE